MKEYKEIEVVTLMIELYCKKNHGSKMGELCPECKDLLDYVKLRRSKCPFKDDKPFCSNCKIHCYKQEYREKIQKVMRFSGPRMMFYHPVIAFRHVYETMKRKRVEKNA